MSSTVVTWIIIGLIVAFVAWIVTIYNSLVAMRQRVSQAFSDIDVQTKQRHDLIPNLIETVKGYAAHERGTLEAVVQARNAAVTAQAGGVAAQAAGALGVGNGRANFTSTRNGHRASGDNFVRSFEVGLIPIAGRSGVKRCIELKDQLFSRTDCEILGNRRHGCSGRVCRRCRLGKHKSAYEPNRHQTAQSGDDHSTHHGGVPPIGRRPRADRA